MESMAGKIVVVVVVVDREGTAVEGSGGATGEGRSGRGR